MPQIMMDGMAYATPLKFVLRDGSLWGLFPGEDGRPDSYDQWVWWGEATPRALEAIRVAGVRIDRED